MPTLQTSIKTKIFAESPKNTTTTRRSNGWHVYCQSAKIYCKKHYPQIPLSTTLLSQLWKLVKIQHEQTFRIIAQQRNQGNYGTVLENAIDHLYYFRQIPAMYSRM